MTTVSVGYGISDPTHDLSLQDGTDAQVAAATATKLGLIFAGGPRVLQEIPLSPPAQAFENEQRNWIGGQGRQRYDDDPTGFFDSFFLWSTSDEKLMPSLQWRFGKSVRTEITSLPTDNSTFSWWKLYGNTPASDIARYLYSTIVPGALFVADKAYFIIRRRGTPGTLTFELCADSVGTPGTPGTVLQTVTKTTSDLTDTISIYQVFDWSGTQSLSSGVTYHLKIYGASTDDASNHWEVLTNASGTASAYSAAGSSWTAAGVSMYYRITDADLPRQWRFFSHEGALYAVSQSDTGATPILMINGTRGTATSATSTTLVCSGLSMSTNQYAGAKIRIYDGLGDGQVRDIVSNTGTAFTVATWDVTPDTTSKFLVYATDYWTVIAGHGIVAISGKPVSTGTVCYFPQGGAAVIRRMRVNGASYDFAADVQATHILGTYMEGATLKVVGGSQGTSTIYLADATVWGVNLTFSPAKTVGTTDYRLNNLYSHNKVLYVFKEDGVYTYSNGLIEKQGNGFSDAPDKFLGIGVGAQNQYLWFGWAHSIERMLGSNIDDMLNYKRGYGGMAENRTGNVSCIVSAVGWLFFVIDGGANNYSSIVAWNGFGFHEIYRGWATGVRIRNAFWQPCLDTRSRLWFEIGGDIAYIEFPHYAANPLRDTNNSPKGNGVNFNWEGAITTSTYDAHDQNLFKILSLLRVFSEAGSVEIDYQTNANVGTNAWTVLGTASTQPVSDLTLNLGEVFQIRFRFRLQITNTRTPPVLTGWQLSGRMIPLTKYQFLATFKTDSDQTTFTDEPDIDPNTLFSQIREWAEAQTKLTMRTQTLSSDTLIVTVSLPSKSVDWIDSGESKWGGRVSMAILQT